MSLPRATQIVIVGSGAGGSPLALRLAQRGYEVLVLEEGGDYTRRDFNQREDTMIDRLYRHHGSQSTDDFAVRVLQGSCVGGSTVINMGDVVPMPDAVVEHWQQQFGLPWSPRDFAAARDRALAMLPWRPIPPGEVNRNGQILLRAARAAGYSVDILHDNREGCVGSGYCMMGCSYDAKRSMIVNYLPAARSAGARVVGRAYVRRVLHQSGRITGVEGEWGEVGQRQPFHIRAQTVIVACGAIHSPLLLERSGLHFDQLGRNLSLQPQNLVMARFRDPVVAFRGIPQSVVVDEFLRAEAATGLGGFVLESILPLPGGLGAGFAPSGIGPELMAMMRTYAHMAGCFVLVPDRPAGRVTTLEGNFARINYEFTPAVRATMWQGILTAARLYLQVGAQEVYFSHQGLPPVRSLPELEQLRDHGFRPILGPTISAHPQGTCRMGLDPRSSVVNPDFQVHGIPNLYVCDTSIFPTTSSTHTMTPTLTMAEFLGERLTT